MSIFPQTTSVTAGVTTVAATWGNLVRQDLTSLSFGWLPGGTWTYATANTFTIAGNYTAWYTRGTRIELTQGVTVKYFVCYADATYSSPNTTIYITGGSDYTLANAAITGTYYSYGNPPDFPYTFNWTPTLGGFSSDPINAVYRFSVTGNICTAVIRQGNGTSDDTVFTISAPITAKTLTDAQWEATGRVADNGSIQASPGYMSIASAASTINVYKTLQDGAWTASGNKRVVSMVLMYEI